MESLRVSVVIPTLNRSHLLVETVRQLLGLDEVPFEIIVVDQTKGQWQWVREKLLALDGRVRYLRHEHPNASAARNLGAVNARGEVLLFLDDDVNVYPGLVGAHKACYGDPEVVGVAGGILRHGRSELTEEKHDPRSYDPEIGYIYFQADGNERRRCFGGGGGNLSFRTRAYLEAGGADERFVKGAYREEADLYLRMLERTGGLLVYEPEAKVYHKAAPTGGIRGLKGTRMFRPHHDMGMYCCLLRHVRSARKLFRELSRCTFRAAGKALFCRRFYAAPLRWLSLVVGFGWALTAVVLGPKGVDQSPAASSGRAN